MLPMALTPRSAFASRSILQAAPVDLTPMLTESHLVSWPEFCNANNLSRLGWIEL